MKKVHMILQGKGGVGKSLIASFLAQHFAARGVTPICIDTDPVNATFAGYREFSAKRLQLIKNDDLDPRAFDELAEIMVAAPDDSTFIIDNGASTFVPLCAWMIENGAVKFFVEHEIELVLHSVVTGGQAQNDTMVGLKNLLEHFSSVSTVIWLNEYFGKPEKNGVTFDQSTLFQEHKDQIHALVRIPAVRKETFGADLDQMLREKQTFKAASGDEKFTLMGRQRLLMIWRDLDRQMQAANL